MISCLRGVYVAVAVPVIAIDLIPCLIQPACLLEAFQPVQCVIALALLAGNMSNSLREQAYYFWRPVN